MAESAVVVQRRICISGGGLKLGWPWVVNDTNTVNGIEFVQLSKRDSGFSRFVSGTPTGARAMTWLDTLRAQRTRASLAAATTGESLFGDAPPTKAAKKKQRQNASAVRSKGELPATVVLKMPGFTGVDGNEVGAMDLQVLSDLDLHACASVELKPENLVYVREAMRHSAQEPGRLRAPSDDTGVRWRADRRVWLAKRTDPESGKSVTKSFKPEVADDEASKEAAGDLAKAWAASGAEADGEGGEDGEAAEAAEAGGIEPAP